MHVTQLRSGNVGFGCSRDAGLVLPCVYHVVGCEFRPTHYGSCQCQEISYQGIHICPFEMRFEYIVQKGCWLDLIPQGGKLTCPYNI